MTTVRDLLIYRAEAYVRSGISLPLDLISALMAEGIDHTQFNPDYREDHGSEIHNVD